MTATKSTWTVLNGRIGFFTPPVREGCRPIFNEGCAPEFISLQSSFWVAGRSPAAPDRLEIPARIVSEETVVEGDWISRRCFWEGEFEGVIVSSGVMVSRERTPEAEERRQAEQARQRAEWEARGRNADEQLERCRAAWNPEQWEAIARAMPPSHHNKLWGDLARERFIRRAVEAHVRSSGLAERRESASFVNGLVANDDDAVAVMRAVVCRIRAERKAVWLAR